MTGIKFEGYPVKEYGCFFKEQDAVKCAKENNGKIIKTLRVFGARLIGSMSKGGSLKECFVVVSKELN